MSKIEYWLDAKISGQLIVCYSAEGYMTQYPLDAHINVARVSNESNWTLVKIISPSINIVYKLHCLI